MTIYAVFIVFWYLIQRTISSPYEWRTFILTWNPQTRNISLYDPDRLIMTYVDTENYDHVNFIHKMYVRCPLEVLMRYHNCEYTYCQIFLNFTSCNNI